MAKEEFEESTIGGSHHLIGIMGLILLGLYIFMAVFFAQFNKIFVRFIELLTAITKNFMLAYVLVPIYINWITTDYFQEKKRTTLGNAATNGFMGLWVGFDWIRQSYAVFKEGSELLLFVGKLIFSILVLLYGLFIVKLAVQKKEISQIIGRVREISYLAIVITPIIYGIVPIDLTTVTAILVFYPLFYGITEFIIYFLLPELEIED